MKKTLVAGILASALMATSSLAGSLNDPIVAVPEVIEDASGSSSGEALVLLLALMMSVAFWD